MIPLSRAMFICKHTHCQKNGHNSLPVGLEKNVHSMASSVQLHFSTPYYATVYHSQW